MKAKRTSLADIAESLKLSKSTVSFVLNGKGDQFNISTKTQKLIRDKAKELNYVPNFFAKGLREGKTQTIGLVLADISNPFYSELGKAIQEALYAEGYSLFIVSTNDDPAIERKLLNDLIQRSVDALIIAPCNTPEDLKSLLEETPVPVVFVDRAGGELSDFVGIDNVKEASRMIGLFSTKPKKVGIIHPEKADVMTIQQRIEGAKKACIREKVPYEITHLADDPSTANAQLSELIQQGVDSIVPLNNKVALSTLAALKRLNIPIPGHVRMISFDDSEAFSYFSPPITALSQPVHKIGVETATLLIERLKASRLQPKQQMMNCTFVARASH